MTENELNMRFDEFDVSEIHRVRRYFDIDLEDIKDVRIYEDEKEAVDAYFPYDKNKNYKRLYAKLDAEGFYFPTRSGLIELICY